MPQTQTPISHLMTSDPVTVRPGESVQRAAELMDELNVGSLPVCNGHEVIGMLTDRDITVRVIAAGLDPATTEVQHAMTASVRCCRPEDSAHSVLKLMSAVQIRRLPVVDDCGRLVGIVSLGDLAARQPAGVEGALTRISTPAQPDRVAA